MAVATRPFIRRRLGRELTRIREGKSPKPTAEQVASRVVLPGRATLAASTVSRIETAKVSVRPSTIAALLKVYEVTGEQADGLMELARNANSEAFWHPYTGRRVLPKWFELYADVEAEASRLRIFDDRLVTGLAQTEDYARAVFRAQREDGKNIDRLVQLRLDRQAQVAESRTGVHMVLDEAVLLRPFGTRQQFRAQLEHLMELAEAQSLQVLPLDAQTPATGPFVILEFEEPEDPSMVYVEHESGALYLESPADLDLYLELNDRLQRKALSPAQTAELIRKVLQT